MFGRKSRFKPEGIYNGFPYNVDASGKIDVDIGNGRIKRFNSFEEMIAQLSADISSSQTPEFETSIKEKHVRVAHSAQTQAEKKQKKGCGCFTLVLLGVVILFLLSNNSSTNKVADILNSQFGRICEARVEGLFSDTLRIDWTAETTKFHTLTVLAAIGSAKETMYSKGIRYLKFPNDAGGYNVIDWKTGGKSSVDERARYYFR